MISKFQLREVLTELSPVTKLGQLRPLACHTGSRAIFTESLYRRIRVASVVDTDSLIKVLGFDH